MSRFVRTPLLCSILVSSPAALVASTAVHAQTEAQTYVFDLPAGDLDAALRAFAHQARQQVVFDGDAVHGKESAAVIGSYTAADALRALLAGSGLGVRTGAKGEFQVIRTAGVHTGALDSEADRSRLEEVIVTAQKRTERLQDVPVPVTALSADMLLERGTPRIQDYFATVPGLSLSPLSNAGSQSLAIRGVTTSANTSPTVGVTIDDVPYGSSSVLANGGFFTADLDPADLKQIEVLRGPQGTLYGASSIGGLIKYTTIDPSLTNVNGDVQLLGSYIEHGEAGYGVRAAISTPISDSFAVRISGFTRYDPGYIENITTGERDVNAARLYGGLLSGLWQPSEDLSLKFSALLQDMRGYGASAIDARLSANGTLEPTLGDLQQRRLIGSEQYRVKTRLYTAKLAAKIGGMDFTSISGYADKGYTSGIDQSSSYHFLTQAARCSCFNGTEKFSQEFRLSSATGQRVEWLAGAFYTHEYSSGDQKGYAINPESGAILHSVPGAANGILGRFYFPTTLSEYALFGDLTLHVTDKLALQVGARESQNRQVYNETDSGPATPAFFGQDSPFVNPTERTKANAFTYLLAPSYKITPDLMAYARVSSGYRVGGPNFNSAVGQIPTQYAPDKTKNYEIGFKGAFLDDRLTLDVSAYYIDWRDIQLSLINPVTFFPYNANAGGAKSQGLELSIQARPARNTTIGFTSSLNQAKLTQDFPASAAALGRSGDRLPFSSRFSGSVTVDQDIPLANQWVAFVGGTAIYVGDRTGEFVSTYTPAQPRMNFPSYSRADLRVGVRDEAWTINLFANNVFDKRGIAGGGTSSAESRFFLTYIDPLTIGVSASRKF